MGTVITVVAVFAVLVGVALGWYLRGANAWCPRCGDAVACGGCGARPHWTAPRRSRRPVG